MPIYYVVSIEGFEPSPLRPKRSMPPDNTLRRLTDNLQIHYNCYYAVSAFNSAVHLNIKRIIEIW